MNIPKTNQNILRQKILKLTFLFILLNIVHPFKFLDISLHITNIDAFYFYYYYKTLLLSNIYT